MHVNKKPTHRPLIILCFVLLLFLLTAGISLPTNHVGAKDSVDVDALLAQMTLEEKLTLLHGIGFFGLPARCQGSAGYVAGVDRLGIPGLCMADGPAGIRTNQPATALPAPVGLAATFNPGLAYRFGQVLGREGRAYGQDVLLAPMVNIVRVPHAGRNFETLGEDPFLANRMVTQEVSGAQSQHLIATIKHYTANNQEENRQSINANVDERTLHEIYLPGFEGAVNGGTGAIMCAYNQVNGAFACENEYLLNTVLRDQWGFSGWVLTDWFANHPSGVYALTAGLDMEMPFGIFFGNALAQAVADGLIPEAEVDQAVRRILVQMERVGLLDGSIPPRPDIDEIKNADAAIAEDIALASAVLLRNEGNALPLRHRDRQSLLVIGPTAVTPLIGGGGSARVIPFSADSPLEALIGLAGDKANISYVPGIDLDGVPIPQTVFQTPDGDPGLLRTDQDGNTQIDPEVDYTGGNTLPPGSSWTWTATLTVPTSGEYELKVQTAGGSAELELDGEELVSTGGFFSDASLIPTAGGLANATARVYLEAGQPYSLILTGGGSFFSPLEQIRLAWVTPEQRAANVAEAVNAAAEANAVILFAYVEGTESEDRADLSLPGNQDELITAVAEASQKTVVVLNIGAPVLMPWVAESDAILNMWYPGQEGAEATAALLLGLANPAGKLPVTFPVSEADIPTNTPEQYPGVDGEQFYSEGIFVGYRWYDAQEIEPLFPFGHGLSYTKFDYSELDIQPSGDGYDISFKVSNVGGRKGAEVAQVYLGPAENAPVPLAPKQLVGFEAITLRRGSSQVVTIHVSARELSYWSDGEDGWRLLSGDRPVYVGSSSRDIRLQGSTGSH